MEMAIAFLLWPELSKSTRFMQNSKSPTEVSNWQRKEVLQAH
jgi:hypothetical protein